MESRPSPSLAPPFLAVLGEEQWAEFREHLEMYRAVGGARPLHQLLSRTVQRMLVELDVAVSPPAGVSGEESKEEQAIAAISELFAPQSKEDAFERFNRIRMSANGFSLEAVLAYNRAYTELFALCAETVRPSDERLRAMYVGGLRPERLARSVDLQEPATLADAKKAAVREVRRLSDMQATLGEGPFWSRPPGPPTRAQPARVAQMQQATPGPRPPTAAGVSSTRKDEPRSSSGAVCFVCGSTGHKAAQCPQRKRVSGEFAPAAGVAQGRSTTTGRPVFPPGRPVTRGMTRAAATEQAARSGASHQSFAITANLGSGEAREANVEASLDVTKVDGGVVAPTRVAVPRAQLLVSAGEGEAFGVSALLDTGSDVNLVSRRVADRLMQCGAVTSTCSPARELRTAAGSALVSEFVPLRVKVPAKSGTTVWLEVSAGVLDLGEELLLGYPMLREAGLVDFPRCLAVQNGAALVPPGGAEAAAIQKKCSRDDVAQEDDAEASGHDGLEDDEPLGGALSSVAVRGGDMAQSFVSHEFPERDALLNLLARFEPVFGDLPDEGTALPAMPIHLKPGRYPKAVPPRRLSPALQSTVDFEVQELLRKGIIVPSTSDVSSPLVIVKKKDGGHRVCVDYRSLNDCTESMKFPIPNTRELLERMSGKTFFAALDLRSGFYQVALEPSAQRLTAFATRDGLFQFTRVPFGLKNAPPYFQRAMSGLLSGLQGVACEVFIDDIIVHGRTPSEFLRHLEAVLQRLCDAGVRLKASKCRFGLPEIDYLGHIVSGQGITLSQARKQGVAGMKAPTSVAKLRSFMGFANYFRPFVAKFALLAKPLTRLCSPKVKFQWSDEQDRAFRALKQAIIDAPVLAYLDYSREVVLRTDASMEGVGAVLLQRDDGGRERPICYVSQAFAPAQTRWSTLEQEAYAVYFAVTTLSHYLQGTPFVVETDHKNLLFVGKMVAPKVVRWRLRLAEYDFAVRHIAGSGNTVADALSRCFVLRDPGDGREDAMQRAHNDVAGHHGVAATVSKLKRMGFRWRGMWREVRRFVDSCPTCQKTMPRVVAPAPPATTVVDQPFEVVALDTIGPLPEDESGNRYLIVLVDCFSRFVELFPAPDVTAERAVAALLQLFGRYGAPRAIRTDQGSQYSAAMVEQFLELTGVARQSTIPYRPKSNGIVERVNAEVLRHLRSLIMDRRVKERWSQFLPLVQRIVNASVHSATGVAPASMIFGNAIDLNRGILVDFAEVERRERMEAGDYVRALAEQQRAIVDAAQRQQQQVVGERLEQGEDAVELHEYAPGELVLASYPNRPPHKLAPRWRGPLEVAGVDGNMIACRKIGDDKLVQIHRDRLRPYRQERTPQPLAVAAVDQDEFLVESVVDHRWRGRRRRRADLEFRVRWAGYEPAEDTWLPYRAVSELAALDGYAAAHPELRL